MGILRGPFRSETMSGQLQFAQVPTFTEGLTGMVLELDPFFFVRTIPTGNVPYSEFQKTFRLFTQFELETEMMVPNKVFFAILTQMVPCISCRRCVENLLASTAEHCPKSYYPVVQESDCFRLAKEFASNARYLYDIFHCQDKSGQLEQLVQTCAKVKQGRRCLLHTTDSQRQKPAHSWVEIWESMDEDCKEEAVTMNVESLRANLPVFLETNKFCSECKTRINLAFHILINETGAGSDPYFCPEHYEHIKVSSDQRCIQLPTEPEYLGALLSKGFRDISGHERTERHAKTLDCAQEELLTYIGVCVFDRFNRIYMRVREDELAWEIVMCVALQALRQNYKIVLEKKLGKSQLELFCEELSKEEQQKQKTKDSRKKRRQRRKQKNKELSECNDEDADSKFSELQEYGSEAAETAEVPNQSNVNASQSQCDEPSEGSTSVSGTDSLNKTIPPNSQVDGNVEQEIITAKKNLLTEIKALEGTVPRMSKTVANPGASPLHASKDYDCGYSSEQINGNFSSVTSDCSEFACSESFCNHEMGTCLSKASNKSAAPSNANATPLKDVNADYNGANVAKLKSQSKMPYKSLAEQLLDSSESEEEELCIPEEELALVTSPFMKFKREAYYNRVLLNFRKMTGTTANAAAAKESVHPSTSKPCVHSSQMSNCDSTDEIDENVPPEREKQGQTKITRTNAQAKRRYKGKNRH